MTCEERRAEAAGLAALRPGDPDREAAFAHARTCGACEAALREGERVVALLASLPPPPPPTAAALRRASAEILRELDAGATDAPARPPVASERPAASWVRWSPVLATAAAWAAEVLGGRHRAPGTPAWGWSASLAAAATLGTAAALWLGAPAAAGLALVSALFSLVVGAGSLLAPKVGAVCFTLELVAAALPLATTAWLVRRGARDGGPALFAGVAASGALAGQAALHLTCPVRTEAPHVFVFHTGGVIAAALIGLLLARPISRARAPAR